MRISVITVCYNRESTIAATIKSVTDQSHRPEHIIVDGHSTDRTLKVIEEAGGADVVVSEPDKGLYDALNKSIKLAYGEIIGFLHSDDVFTDNLVIESVRKRFIETNADAVYGDLDYVSEDLRVIKRKWRSGEAAGFTSGWMPPHPTLYVKKEIFDRVGLFRTDMGSAADYEWMLRAIQVHKIKMAYLPKVMVNMRVGGMSNENASARKNAFLSDLKAWEVNGLGRNYLAVVLKKLRKLPQYF